ncbi:hypothetical protein VTN02DRAFT_5256 [Thermoascus thermophilus]
MATTPPPPSTLRIPPTPRHGAGYYSYEPYTTRQSARLASQRAARDSQTTPPPPSPSGLRDQARRKQSDDAQGTLSPPGTIQASPRKKPSGRSRGVLPSHSLDHTADVDATNTEEHTLLKHSSLRAPRTMTTAGMLPTPAKTPRKKAVGDVGSTARTLFPTAPSRPKKGKKYTAFSLESFEEDPSENHGKIEIFTDSRDRIPELDESEGNPFYKKPSAAESSEHATSRTSKRRKADGIKRDKEVDEAIKRDDGMFYIFRGKKTFRKFEDDADAESDDDDLGLLAARPDLIDADVSARVRPLTRSSIKPRVLFPSAAQETPSSADEEAPTDIEENADANETADEADTTDVEMEQPVVTPEVKSAVTTPPSPGATTRTLRPRVKKDDDVTPSAPEPRRSKRISPFDGWMRKKQTPSPTGTATKAKKRDAESVGGMGVPAAKKTKGK